MKKLYKSTDRDVFGVIGGIAEYYNINPASLRIAWLVLACLTGVVPGLLLYITATVVIPEQPKK